MRGVGYAILYSIDLKDDVLLYKVNVERYINLQDRAIIILFKKCCRKKHIVLLHKYCI